MASRRLVLTGLVGLFGGCFGPSESEEGGNAGNDSGDDTDQDETKDEYTDIEPVGDIDRFPGHGNMVDGKPEAIADFSAFVTRLEGADLEFEEPEYYARGEYGNRSVSGLASQIILRYRA